MTFYRVRTEKLLTLYVIDSLFFSVTNVPWPLPIIFCLTGVKQSIYSLYFYVVQKRLPLLHSARANTDRN